MLTLFSKSKFLDNSAVTLDIFLRQVVEKLSAPGHHFQKTAPGMKIFLVCFEVFR
jgi:hypothetical protein